MTDYRRNFIAAGSLFFVRPWAVQQDDGFRKGSTHPTGYNSDTGRFGTFATVGAGGGLDISANIVFQQTFGGPQNFFGQQFGSGFVGARGLIGVGPTYDSSFHTPSTYLNPTGYQVSVGASLVQAATGLPVGMSAQNSITYETTAAVTAALSK